MALPDITDLTDTELDDLVNAVLALKEKRARLAEAPQRIAAEVQRFIDDGGNPAAIVLPTEPTSPAPVEVPGVLVEADAPPVDGEQVGGFEPERGDEVPLSP